MIHPSPDTTPVDPVQADRAEQIAWLAEQIEGNTAHPADLAQTVERWIAHVPAGLVDRFARLHPRHPAVQRLLLLHEEADLDLVALHLEQVGSDGEAVRQSKVLGDAGSRLMDILDHDRARWALLQAARWDRAALLQLLAFVQSPEDVAHCVAHLADLDLPRALTELERRFPADRPLNARVYATLLASPSRSFRLRLIERARTSVEPVGPEADKGDRRLPSLR
jgi:hypothetical protein